MPGCSSRAGSTGGYFGGRLASGRPRCHVSGQASPGGSTGRTRTRDSSPHGDFTLAETGHRRPVIRPYDAILLSVKAFSLESALSDMAGAVGPETMILPVLNGMRHVDILADQFGKRSVVGAPAKSPRPSMIGPYRAAQLASGYLLWRDGRRGVAAHPRTRSIHARWRIRRATVNDIKREMWRSGILLAGLGGNQLPDARHHRRGGASTARIRIRGPASARDCRCGAGRRRKSPPRIHGRAKMGLTAPDSTQTSSMYRDLSRGVPSRRIKSSAIF